MSNDNTTTHYGGIGFVGLLTIVFITLKLTGVIAWSWLWVLSPIWISISLWFAIILILSLWFAIILILIFFVALAEGSNNDKRRSR